MAEKKKGEREEMRKLKEGIKRLEQKEPSNGKKEGEEESTAGGLLKGIGQMIPGLGSLLKGIEKSPAFKERLKAIDEEVERKLGEEPPKKVKERGRDIPTGIPPGARGKTVGRGYSVRKRATTPRPGGPPPAPEERPVDIFDEKDHVKIIGEIPGVDEKDIKVNLKNDIITIRVDLPHRKYHQSLKVSCKPQGKIEKSYKNGILEVVIKK